MRYLLSMILVISFSSVSYSSQEYGRLRCYITGINHVNNIDKLVTEREFETNSIFTKIYSNHTIDVIWNNENLAIVHNDNQGEEIDKDAFPLRFPTIIDLLNENEIINAKKGEDGTFYINITSSFSYSPEYFTVISLRPDFIEIIDSPTARITKKLALNNLQSEWRGFLTIDSIFNKDEIMMDVVGLKCAHKGAELKILTQTYN